MPLSLIILIAAAERLGNMARDGASRLHGLYPASLTRLQGWKGSAKARHLVMALREFYAERYADAADEGVITVAAPRKAANTPVSPIWASTSTYQQRRKAVGVRPEDRWTLDYITILRIQPLLEAFDDDASSFVTVSEVNAFTQARPRDWR